MKYLHSEETLDIPEGGTNYSRSQEHHFYCPEQLRQQPVRKEEDH